MSAASPDARPRYGRAVVGIFLILLVWLISFAKSFLLPVVLGLLLALVFSPVRRAMSRFGIGDGTAAGLIVVGLLTMFLTLTTALTAPISGWIDDAPRISREIEQKLTSVKGLTDSVRNAAAQVERITQGPEGAVVQAGEAAPSEAGEPATAPPAASEAEAEAGVQRVVVDQPNPATDFVLRAPSIAGQFVFTLVLLFFLLASGDLFYEKVVAASPTFRDKRRAVVIAREIERQLSQYLLTITLINAGLGCAIGLLMWALGMPNPLLFGVIGFLFNYVPFVGALAGVVIAFGVGLVEMDTIRLAALSAGGYFALTSIEGQFVTPYFVGRSLRLNTVVVFLAVTFWAWLWSIVGMLVALPLLVAVKVFCDHVPGLAGLGLFLSERDSRPNFEDTATTTS